MISLFLMTKKGYAVLEEISKSFGPAIIEKVVAAEDKSIQEDYYAEIKSYCEKGGIPFFNRKQKFAVTTTYAIAISWRWLIHDVPNLIVIHDSLLPQYRGFNPLVTALINGDSRIGVTALFANNEFDSGDIIYQSETAISYPISIGAAIDKVTGCYRQVVKRICADLVSQRTLPSSVQDESKATYSLWRDERDYRINWNGSSTAIQRFIDAVGHPYNGAQAIVDGKSITIVEAIPQPEMIISNRTPGKVILIRDNAPFVVCGQGILKITQMKDEDGKAYQLTKTRTRFE